MRTLRVLQSQSHNYNFFGFENMITLKINLIFMYIRTYVHSNMVDLYFLMYIDILNVHLIKFFQPMTFQAILTTNGRYSFAVFYYKSKEMLQELNAIDNSCMRAQVGFSAGKQYSTYVTTLSNKQKMLLSNFKSISRCQRRIIIELYNKNTLDNLGCNNKGMQTE